MEQDKRLIKGQKMRQTILLAALEIISLDGLGKISATHIAQAIGTSKSNIFHHFQTKEAILLETYDFLCEGFSQMFNPPVSTLPEYLSHLGAQLFGAKAAEDPNRHYYKAFYAYYNEGLFNDTYKTKLNQSTALLLSALKAQLITFSSASKLSEEVLNHRAEVAALGILSFLDGSGLHLMLNPSLELIEEVWQIQSRNWENYLLNA